MDNSAKHYHLTDEQWQVIQPLIPPPSSAATRGRPPISERAVLDGIFWKIITACAWYHLPSEYPSWQTCYRRYSKWRNNGLLHEILNALYLDLCDRGGLDLQRDLHDGPIKVTGSLGHPKFEVAPSFQDTWQFMTAMIFLRLAAQKMKQNRIAPY
jgi:transposase